MKYAREVIDCMSAHPGREFRMGDLIRYACGNIKGKERHARGKPFDKQPIMEISRMVGPGYATGQAMKKLQEAKSMMDRGQLAAAKAEALGAINYSAAFFLLIEETEAEVAAATSDIEE